MLRVSPDQYSLLQRRAAGKPVLREPGSKRARVKKRAADLPENQVEGQITGYLRARGWICTKQHAGMFRRMGNIPGAFTIGEKGQADWRAERPIIPPGMRVGPKTNFRAELFYYEIKAPGKEPEPHQRSWIDRRQLTGITAAWFDSLASFAKWYERRYGMRGGDPPGIAEESG